jgi:cold shock CspA family protein
MTGICTYWHKKGFGYLRPLIGLGPDAPVVFFHASAICGQKGKQISGIPAGAECSFDLVRGREGKPQAINVKPTLLSADSLDCCS